MTRAASGLEEIVREYHHLQEEHRRAGPESSVRRHLRARLEELERGLERLLAEDVGGESERAAWRERLHHGSAAPAAPLPHGELVFKGRSEAGSVVEIRTRPDGDLDVAVDGRPAERMTGPIDFIAYVDGDREFPEVFESRPDALEALRDWVGAPQGEPPWERAHALLEDGLIDRHFGLTRRGHRALRR